MSRMSDFVSREKTFDVLSDYYHHKTQVQHQALKEALDRVPSAEKTGRWIWDENGIDFGIGAWICSACGSKSETFWQTYKESNPNRYAGSHYCGNCGAKMEVSE